MSNNVIDISARISIVYFIPTGENGPNAFYGLGICYIDGLGYGHTGALPGYLLIESGDRCDSICSI